MMADVDCVFSVISKDQMAPIVARGMAVMMVSGWTKEWKAGMKEKYRSTMAMSRAELKAISVFLTLFRVSFLADLDIRVEVLCP